MEFEPPKKTPSTKRKYASLPSEKGRVYVWGDGKDGRLGLGEEESSIPTPTLIEMPIDVKFVTVQSGSSFNVALTETGVLYTWGLGSYGRLGHGDKQTQYHPKLIEGIKNIEKFAVGSSHVVALDDDGVLYTWGYGKHGALGHGDELSHYRPKKIEGYHSIRFTNVTAGLSHTLAISDDGTIFSWGSGNYGKLGHGHTNDVHKPKQIRNVPKGVEFFHVQAGQSHCVAVSTSGGVWTWGCGAEGRLGHGREDNVLVPTKVVCGNVNFVSVCAGYRHSAALTEQGKIYIWGSGSDGKLGLGSERGNVLSPTQIPNLDLFKFISISAGETHTAALTEEGSIFTWGNGEGGKLGHGIPCDSLWRPTMIKGFDWTIFSSVNAGKHHTVALTGMPLKQSPQKIFREHLLSLLDMSEFSDMKVTINGSTFHLHRIIIQVRCPDLLDERILSNLPVSQRAVSKFIKYLYGEHLPGINTPMDINLEIYLLSWVFRVENLNHYCTVLLEKMINNQQTTIEAITFGVKYQLPFVIKKAMDFIDNNKEDFRDETVISNLKALLQSDPTSLSFLESILSLIDSPKGKKIIPNAPSFSVSNLPGFEVLFQKGLDHDFILRLQVSEEEEYEIPVHKAILACRSPFFAGALRAGMIESKAGAMTLLGPSAEEHGITITALKALILYFYTGKMDHLNDPVDCLYILSVSGYYALHDHQALLVHCYYHIRNRISIDNCLELFQVAHKLSIKQFKEKSLSFILSHYEEVAPFLSFLPVEIFMEINVGFNLRLIQKYGPLM